MLVRTVLLAGSGLVLVGCGCNQEHQFLPSHQPDPLAADHGQWLSMDVAPNGDLAVTYYDRDASGIGFARGEIQDDLSVWWFHEKVDGYPDSEGVNPGERGKFTSMEVAPDGVVWASYYDAVNGALRVAKRTGDTWETEPADGGSGPSPHVGMWTSLALDAEGNPVIAHFDKAEGSLRVARRSADGAWSAQEARPGVSPEAGAGSFARLFIDGSTEYIVYYDAATGSVDLLEGFADAYSHEVIYDQGDVGQWPSLWKDGDSLHVAFHAVDTQDLMLATREGTGGWDVQVVDDAEYVGADTEVFVRDGRVHIVYFDGYENDMKLAVETDEGWDIQVLGGEGVAVGYHNEVAFDGTRWWVASYNYTNRDIFVRPLP